MNATDLRRPRALLLDDDPVVLRLLGTSLQARGFEVRAAADGESGLALLLDELLDLDVLVVDLDMPGRDGWDLLHLVRRAGGERDLGVVVLAATADRGVREQLLLLGADAVVDRAAGPAAAAATVRNVADERRSRHSRSLLLPRLDGALALARCALRPSGLAGAAA